MRDSAPQVGDESRFDDPPEKWVAKKLSFGRATTSAVVEAGAGDRRADHHIDHPDPGATGQ